MSKPEYPSFLFFFSGANQDQILSEKKESIQGYTDKRWMTGHEKWSEKSFKITWIPYCHLRDPSQLHLRWLPALLGIWKTIPWTPLPTAPKYQGLPMESNNSGVTWAPTGLSSSWLVLSVQNPSNTGDNFDMMAGAFRTVLSSSIHHLTRGKYLGVYHYCDQAHIWLKFPPWMPHFPYPSLFQIPIWWESKFHRRDKVLTSLNPR